MDLIEEAFGRENVILKPFERGQMHKADLISDFLKTVGLEIDEDELIRGTENESLHTALLDVLHEINNSHGKVADNRNLLSLSDFIKQECNIPVSTILLDDEARAEILETYASFYEVLSERYNENRPLFLDPVPKMEYPREELAEGDRELVRHLLFSVAKNGFSADRLKSIQTDFHSRLYKEQ